ncbi:MAG: glycosyltransferase 87 family protein [Chthoniobacteraceae bacterium]
MTPTARTTPSSSAPVPFVLLALLAMTLLKILWALNSAGSVDVILFYNFGHGVQQYGLTQMYGMDEKFNHTPLTAGFAWLLYHIAGNDKLEFAFLLRLASIIADIAVVAALLRWRAKLGNLPPWWALIVFAASPVSLMVSGFHGNVDPVMVALLFLATVAAACERPVLCGVLFGLAANVKIVPIIVSPVFFFFWLGRTNPGPGLLRFMLASGSVMLAGWALPLVVCPRDYLHNVFGYGSTWGVWGLPYLLRMTGWEAVQKIDFKGLTTTQNMLAAGLKFTAIGGISAIGWLRRKVAPAELAATVGMAWLVFFIFAPGVGVQYMVWAAPFLLLLSAPGYAVITAASTVFLFSFYHTTSSGRWPWFFAVPRGPETPIWSAWGVFAWLSFLCVFIALASRWCDTSGKKAKIISA